MPTHDIDYPSVMNSIGLGLRWAWSSNNRILIYEVSAISPNLMVEWSNHLFETLSSWPDGTPIQILFNLSRPRVTIPYMVITNRNMFDLGMTDTGRARLQGLFESRQNLSGRLALLLPSSTSGGVAQARSRNSAPRIEGRLFTAYFEAIEWLKNSTHSS